KLGRQVHARGSSTVVGAVSSVSERRTHRPGCCRSGPRGCKGRPPHVVVTWGGQLRKGGVEVGSTVRDRCDPVHGLPAGTGAMRCAAWSPGSPDGVFLVDPKLRVA